MKYTSSEIQVIYDETLVQHADGHLSGKIINYGEVPVYNIKVYAIIHGFDEVLDMGQNIDMIEKLEPGETRNFVMYPDPSINSEISYYSCFAVTDSFVRPGWAKGEIDDEVFVRGIEFMIKEKVIIIDSKIQNEIQIKEKTIPEWFRNNAQWWSEDNIENETFAKGLEYLINHGIVKV